MMVWNGIKVGFINDESEVEDFAQKLATNTSGVRKPPERIDIVEFYFGR
jgi:hypothetical protein